MALALMPTNDEPPPAFGYRWFSRRLHPERKGQRCRIVAWELKTQVGGGISGAWRTVRVEFADGFQVVAERGMIKTGAGYSDAVTSRFGERNGYAAPAEARAERRRREMLGWVGTRKPSGRP